MIEIEEPAAVDVGDDAGERRRFGDALRTATADLGDTVHLSLVLTGGNVDAIGAATIYDLPFSSYAFDLIAGPDNWRLIAEAPADRGIVCGALDPSADAADRPELLVWAAHYAASIKGRGLVRVGLANASSLGGLTSRAGSREGPGSRVGGPARRHRLARRAGRGSRSAGGRHPVGRARPVRAQAQVTGTGVRGSLGWRIALRVMYRFLRLIDPLIRSWLRMGVGGLDGVVEVRVAGRRSGAMRTTLLTLLGVDGEWYIGHPNGDAEWTRNAEAAGIVQIDPPAPGGDMFSVVRLPPGSGT